MAKMSATNVKGESDVKGHQPPEPGLYHVLVQEVDDTHDKGESTDVSYEVLAGTVADQRGRVVREKMFLEKDGSYTDRHLRFAIATGLIAPGEEKDIDFHDAKGRQLIIKVGTRTDKKDEKKKYACVDDNGYALWSLGNPDTTDVPRDTAAARLAGGTFGPGAGGGKPKDKYGDL